MSASSTSLDRFGLAVILAFAIPAAILNFIVWERWAVEQEAAHWDDVECAEPAE